MNPLDPNLRIPAPGTVVALPTGGAGKIEGDLLRALLKAGHVEARVLQLLGNQSVLIDFLSLGKATVRSEAALKPGDVFTAVLEPRAEGSADPLKLKIAEIRHEPAAPMKPERLASELTEMRLPTDAKHQAMARALLRHAGTVSREAMMQLNEALTRLSVKLGSTQDTALESIRTTAALPSGAQLASEQPKAELAAQAAAKLPVPVKVLEAAAFLVAKGLPVTEEAVDWVAGRLNPASTSGERLGAIARQVPDPATAAAQALAALELPDGEASETAEHLAKLARAFTPPEAQIARVLGREAAPSRADEPAAAAVSPGDEPESAGREVAARSGVPAEPARPSPGPVLRGAAEPLMKIQEALTSVLERAVRTGEGGEPIREALAEVRFGQLVNVAASDPQQASAERALAMPLWWNGGSGEIRVQYKARDGKKRSGGEASETRVVVTLDTAHLQRVKVDLLLGRKQLNCQVSVEDPAIAEVLREHLPELEEALSSTGLRVNALGVKHVSPKASATAIDALRQVDVWL